MATKERDSHPDEHSDGHLGGLDVYIRSVDTAQDLVDTRRLLRQLVREERIEVLTGVMTSALAKVVHQELTGTPTVLLAVNESRFTGDSFDPAFVAAFKAEYGYAPSRAARQGYCIAQTIDRAVRTLAGDFSSPERLSALLADVACRE